MIPISPKKLKLDIVARTHSGKNVHDGTRVMPVGKEELVLRCLVSLVESAERAAFNNDVRLTVIDDHSTESCVDGIKKILSGKTFPTEFVPLQNGTGNGASLRAVYDHALANAREAILFVEDDYLILPECISEMAETYELFKRKLGGGEVGLFPVDYPDDYLTEYLEPSRIVLGTKRHWRTNTYTTGTFMISLATLIKYWDKYMEFTEYGKSDDIHEGTTLNYAWRTGVALFSPIPTLAFHLQFAEHVSPFTDRHIYWNKAGDSLRALGIPTTPQTNPVTSTWKPVFNS